MVSASAAVLALAVLCWPIRPGMTRLRGVVAADARPRGRTRLPRPTTFVVAFAFGSVGWALVGAGGAAAGALAAATAWRRLAARRALHRTLTAVNGLTEALRSVVAELRAGAHPA
ncbi:MAG TPA: type II secretion system protein, partial [Actinophytocola sp.]|nr:type II secretion system protein [Actinophytocola sp.]